MCYPNKALLVTVVLALVPGLCHAVPTFWASRIAYGDKQCGEHPAQPYGAHGEPTADPPIVIGVSAEGYCPGVDLPVTVTYPEGRRSFLTTTKGEFEQPYTTVPGVQQCANQQAVYMAITDSITNTIRTDCSTTGDMVIKVTSASSAVSPYYQASVTVPRRTSGCPEASPCAVAVPPSVDTKSPSPSYPPPIGFEASVSWFYGMPAAVKPIPVDCGTYINLIWSSGTHDVVVAPGDTCEGNTAAGAVELAPAGPSGNVTVVLDTPGIYSVICTVGLHCSAGGMQRVYAVSDNCPLTNNIFAAQQPHPL